MKRPRIVLSALMLAAIIAALAAVACGGADDEAAPAAPSGAQPTAAPQPAASTDEQPGKGQRVTVLITNLGNGRFDPLLSDGEDLKYQRMFNTPLVGGKGGSTLTSAIAKSWELSADAKVWTFTVNEDFIKFHNGDVLEAEDVFFTLDKNAGDLADKLLADGIYEPRDVADYNFVSAVKHTPGTDKVSIEWSEPRPDFGFFYSENAQGAAGMVLSKDYFEQNGGIEGYEQKPIGTGPFKVTNFVPEQKYEFERFADYFWHPGNGFDEDRRPKFEFLTIEVVTEDSTRIAALQSGEADIVEANMLMVDQIEGFGGGVAWQNESSHHWVVMVDCWDPSMWCYDKRVRQAADYAIDKQAIINNLYSPESAVAKGWGWVTPSSLGYGPGLDPFPFDPEKARQLLREAGIVDGKFNGQQVAFDIWTWEAGDLPFLPQMAELFRDAWQKELGFKVTVNVGDASAVRQRWNNRQLPGSVLVRTNEARYDGTSITTGGYNNPEIAWRAVRHPDEQPWASTLTPVVRKGLADVNPATRHQSFNEMYKVLHDDHSYWSILYTNLPWGLGTNVKSYQPWSLVPYVTAIWTVELE